MSDEFKELWDELDRFKVAYNSLIVNGVEPISREAVRQGLRLQSIIDKLPRTADGAIIVPGMKLYPLHPLPAEDLDGEEDHCLAQMHAIDPFDFEEIEPEALSKNYSSKEAATEARKVAQRCEIHKTVRNAAGRCFWCDHPELTPY